MKEKHVPERTCVACGAVRPKKELLRIVLSDDGISFDPGGRKNKIADESETRKTDGTSEGKGNWRS